jgi:acetyl esterase/lipase
MVATQAAGPTDLVSYQVKPSDTDARITRFDNPHYVVFNRSTPSSADLFVHMVGTGGVAANRTEYLAIVAAQGYRVISLSYNNTPAVVARCPRQADAACSGDFRRERLFGENVSAAIDDRPEESIINRLVKLLQHLDREHPGEGWASYLGGDGPDWERIAFGGHSQGAGMAAYLARQKKVARVVLLSGPTDFLMDRSRDPRSARPFGGSHDHAMAAFSGPAYVGPASPREFCPCEWLSDMLGACRLRRRTWRNARPRTRALEVSCHDL